MTPDTRKRIEAIRTREDLAAFLRELYDDYRKNPESWENNNLMTFLDGLSAWVADMDGYYINKQQPVPHTPEWKTFAEIIVAATMYE